MAQQSHHLLFVVLRLVFAAEVTAGGCFVVPCVVCDVALGEDDVGPNTGKIFNLFPQFCKHT